MKINFKKIKIQNFMSIGAIPIEYEYTSGIHRVRGTIMGEDTKNGVGKSIFLLDALIFALYGKSIRNLNLDEMINSINEKECEITLWFEIDDIPYRIERGLKPNYLKFINENLESDNIENNEKVKKKNTQQDIDDVIKINYKTLINIITMNLNYSKPFFKLTPPEKRQILEDCTNVSIYGKMYEKSKKLYNEYKNDKKVLATELTYCQSNYNDKLETFSKLETMKQNFENEKNNKIKELEEKINIYKEKITILEKKIINKNFDDIKNKLETVYNSINSKIINLQSENKYIEKDNSKLKTEILDLENNPICPRCKTPNSSDHTKDHISNIKNTILENENKLLKNNNEILENKQKQNEIKTKLETVISTIEKLNKINYEIENNKNLLNSLETNLEKEKNKKFSINTIISQDDIDKAKLNLETKQSSFNEVDKKLKYYDYLKEILGDSGIKTYIIKKLVPILNKKMNHYLNNIFKFNHSIQFDNELNETLKSRKRDVFSYENFSSGEQRKLDLSMMFSILALNKSQNSIDCNLLILDEVLDSSLCDDSTYKLMDFLKNEFKSEHSNLSTYIISHKNEISNDNFDTIIHLIKKNNFTHIDNIEKIEQSKY